METEILPDPDGNYVVPRYFSRLTWMGTEIVKNGIGCIGLQWDTGRLLAELSVEFAKGSKFVSSEGVQVQYWSTKGIAWVMHEAGSAWQGHWRPLKGKLEWLGDRLVFRIDPQEQPEGGRGIQKIRWLFPPTAEPVVLRSVSAYTASEWRQVELFVQLEKPLAGKRGGIEVWNGEIISPTVSSSSLQYSWDLSKPTRLKLRYCESSGSKLDRTVVRFSLPGGSFGVAVDDVLANECVYVRDFGLFAARYPANVTLAEYQKKVAGKKTILQRVREMPDQTFTQAWEKVHRAIQDNGPMMISLACDNYKFIVEREGSIQFSTIPDTVTKALIKAMVYPCQVKPTLGSGKNVGLTRHREGGWLPIPVTEVREDGVIYRQRTYVAPYDDESLKRGPSWMKRWAVCVAEFAVENPQSHDANISLKIEFWADATKQQTATLQQTSWGAIAWKDGRIIACIDTTGTPALQTEIDGGSFLLHGPMRANGRAACTVYIATCELSPEKAASLRSGANLWRNRVVTHWDEVMTEALQLTIPEPLLSDIIRAAQVDCLIATRYRDDGAQLIPWIAATSYGPMESEAQAIIYGMDSMGYHDFARRAHEFYISQYNAAGYLTTGYTIIGTGYHLKALGRHYGFAHDTDWFRKIALEAARACRWVIKQRSLTKRLDVRGQEVPEYGLMPPAVIADWNTYTYRFFSNALFSEGLYDTGLALESIQYPGATHLVKDAEDFRKEVLRAYRWTQSRTPALPLSNGNWVPGYPATLHAPGPMADFFPGEDWGRIAASDIEIGSHHLAALDVVDPNSREAEWILEHAEDVIFLSEGLYEYPTEMSRKDWFNLGGFSRAQPYYCQYTTVYALRDDVKPFIRSYFNPIPALVSRENLTFWEHFHNGGTWDKAHETGAFLQQTRLMYVVERGNELWLAPFVTNNWLKDGETVSVRNAPTRFGKVSYKINSHAQSGFINATIEPPARNAPDVIVIRLRHPEGRHMRAVKVNGKRHTDFDPKKEVIRIKPTSQSISVHANY